MVKMVWVLTMCYGGNVGLFIVRPGIHIILFFFLFRKALVSQFFVFLLCVEWLSSLPLTTFGGLYLMNL